MRYILTFLLLFTFVVGDDDYKDEKHYYSKDLSYLNLDKKQIQKVRKALEEYQKDIKKYRKTKKKVLLKKQKIFINGSFDDDKIKKLHSKLSQKAYDIEEDFLESMHKILTKQQRKQFSNFIYEWEVE